MGDHCDKDGAERLGKIIADYWAKRGMIVRMEYVHADFIPAMRTARVDIRSNMVNGFPRPVPRVLSGQPMDRGRIQAALRNPITLDNLKGKR